MFNSGSQGTGVAVWRPSEERWLKFNVGDSLSGSLQANCGGVLRGPSGQWVSGFCRNMDSFTSENIFPVELHVILNVVEVVMSLEIARLVIESGSLSVYFLNAPLDTLISSRI